MVISRQELLAKGRMELLALQPEDVAGRQLQRDEIEAIFGACDAFWLHPTERSPEAPHALLTSGLHSNGYVNCRLVLMRTNLCQIMAAQLVQLLRGNYQGTIEWVVGSHSAATDLTKDVANLAGANHYPLEKGPDDTQVWGKVVIPEDASVLHVEELRTTAKTTLAVRSGIRKGNPYPVNFIRWLPILIDRPEAGQGNEVDGSLVISLVRYEIWTSRPEACPLCQHGSKVVRPSELRNWQMLVESMKT